jgi:hypothetical protein
MSVDDFTTYFSMVTICRVHDDYEYEAMKLKQQGDRFSVV